MRKSDLKIKYFSAINVVELTCIKLIKNIKIIMMAKKPITENIIGLGRNDNPNIMEGRIMKISAI